MASGVAAGPPSSHFPHGGEPRLPRAAEGPTLPRHLVSCRYQRLHSLTLEGKPRPVPDVHSPCVLCPLPPALSPGHPCPGATRRQRGLPGLRTGPVLAPLAPRSVASHSASGPSSVMGSILFTHGGFVVIFKRLHGKGLGAMLGGHRCCFGSDGSVRWPWPPACCSEPCRGPSPPASLRLPLRLRTLCP